MCWALLIRVVCLRVSSGGCLAGFWYSHPQHTECKEGQRIGTPSAPGFGPEHSAPPYGMCTWARAAEARVVRGWELLEMGLDISALPDNATDAEAVARVRDAARVIRKTFDSAPLQPQRCGSQAGNARVMLQ